MPGARALEELVFARYLQPLEPPLEPEGHYETVHLEADDQRSEIEDVRANGGRFLEFAASGFTFSGGTFRHARLTDVWMRAVRWIGSDLALTSWMDAEINDSVFAGVQMFDSIARRVTFHGCRFDSVNLRSATLTDVTFVDCQLAHVDFGGATLTNVSFPGTRLERARFERAKFKAVDFSGAAELEIAAGHESLAGATISALQLMALAGPFAAALGITVTDS